MGFRSGELVAISCRDPGKTLVPLSDKDSLHSNLDRPALVLLVILALAAQRPSTPGLDRAGPRFEELTKNHSSQWVESSQFPPKPISVPGCKSNGILTASVLLSNRSTRARSTNVYIQEPRCPGT